MWAKIAEFLRALLGIQKDVDRIMKPFVKVTTELKAFADKQVAQAEAERRQAEALRQAALAREAESARAQKLAAGVGSLI